MSNSFLDSDSLLFATSGSANSASFRNCLGLFKGPSPSWSGANGFTRDHFARHGSEVSHKQPMPRLGRKRVWDFVSAVWDVIRCALGATFRLSDCWSVVRYYHTCGHMLRFPATIISALVIGFLCCLQFPTEQDDQDIGEIEALLNRCLVWTCPPCYYFSFLRIILYDFIISMQ